MLLYIFLIIITFIIILVFIATYNISQKRLPAKRKRFDGRTKMDILEIYDAYYKDTNIDKNRFSTLWLVIGELLKIDTSLLRPSDSFDKELKPVAGYFVEDEIMDLQDYLRKEARIRNINFGKQKLDTLDEVVKLFCKI